ncbi:hypothetical protein TeGR_g7824 [Tetraparma gracilis]|uniref:HMG box domain-containing protein n=1 Tax=Tetraparma gracilis TaxID=2962635 RepID=A0ABQ6MRJ8_9STRA|nr:hypothetical protein TeGR_g7824 [Tetraparma gracilis]
MDLPPLASAPPRPSCGWTTDDLRSSFRSLASFDSRDADLPPPPAPPRPGEAALASLGASGTTASSGSARNLRSSATSLGSWTMEDAGIYAALRRGSSGSAGLGAGGKKEGLGDGFPRGFFERVPGGETLGELRGRLPDVPAFGLPAALPSLPAWGGARAVPPAAAPAAAKAVKADPARKRSGGRKAAKKVKDPYKPKRPLSSYNFFFRRTRDSLLSAEDTKRYQREMEQYKAGDMTFADAATVSAAAEEGAMEDAKPAATAPPASPGWSFAKAVEETSAREFGSAGKSSGSRQSLESASSVHEGTQPSPLGFQSLGPGDFDERVLG